MEGEWVKVLVPKQQGIETHWRYSEKITGLAFSSGGRRGDVAMPSTDAIE
jgi:hypothetical protein